LRLSRAPVELDPSTRILPLCNHDPALLPALEIAGPIEDRLGSDKASATAMAATCCPVISPSDAEVGAATVAGITDSVAATFGDRSLSSRLMALIDRDKIANTAKTMPMPTRLNVNPSFSRS